ncbi:hypothetical protein [Natronomonas amylolytica]
MVENGKEPYPDVIEETTIGWPDDDEELDFDEDAGPEEGKEPYPTNDME